jgi:hypothetical protein
MEKYWGPINARPHIIHCAAAERNLALDVE